MFRARPAVSLIVFLAWREVTAVYPGFEPTIEGRTAVALRDCPVLSLEGVDLIAGREITVYGEPGGRGPRLVARAILPFEGVSVGVRSADGTAARIPVPATTHPPNGLPETAWCADVNGDGALDFVLLVNTRGNGLGGAIDDLVFALSDGAAYRVWVVPTLLARKTDVFALPGKADVHVLQANYVNVETAGRPRGYFKYGVLRIRGGEVESVPMENFPLWIRWRGRENHEPEPGDPALERGATAWELLDSRVSQK